MPAENVLWGSHYVKYSIYKLRLNNYLKKSAQSLIEAIFFLGLIQNNNQIMHCSWPPWNVGYKAQE